MEKIFMRELSSHKCKNSRTEAVLLAISGHVGIRTVTKTGV